MDNENIQNDWVLPKEFKLDRSRIMYIENKSDGLEGEARIGRVYFSKTGKRFITKVPNSKV